MSALSLPPTAAVQTPAGASAAPATRPSRRAPGRPDLRLVASPPRSSLAPTGPLQAWRRRLGVLLVLAALLVLGAQALAGSPASTPELVPVSTATVVVEPGQTLWDVAVEHAPVDVQPAAYLHDLAELNGITNGAVDAWQVLRLPDA